MLFPEFLHLAVVVTGAIVTALIVVRVIGAGNDGNVDDDNDNNRSKGSNDPY